MDHALDRIAALEREIARLKDDVLAGEADTSTTSGEAPETSAVSRRRMLGAVGAGMTGAIGALVAASASPALARPGEAEVVLGSGGHAWSVTDDSFNTTPAVGDGATDDTLAFQEHLSVLAYFGGGILFVPFGRYRITGTLTVGNRVHLVGESDPRAPKGYTGTVASTFLAQFDGTLIEVTGSYSSLRNLMVLNGGAYAQNADPAVASLRVASKHVTVADCMIYRQGYAGLVLEQGSGGAQIIRNRIIANSRQGNRTTQSHGLVLQNVPDSLITENDISADGTALFSAGGSGNLITSNFIYNATEGIRLTGQGWNVVAGNRLDEHDRTAIVVDWGSRSNVISGNSIHLNGVDTGAPAEERSGLVIGSNSNGISPPAANAIVGNTFSNRTHDDKVRTQQYGVVLTAAAAGNLVSSNTFYDQRVASILDHSNGANTIGTNAIVDEAT